MKDHPRARKIGRVLILYIALAIFLFSTDPSNLPLILLLVPFLLLFFSLFGTIYYGFALFIPATKLARPKRMVIAGCLALLPVILLVLKSINQLTVRDVLIFGIFTLSLVLYLTRTHFTQP